MFGKILDYLDKILTFFEEWTLFVSVIVALIALFINVILRYIFNYSLAWSEELVREVIIYTTFIGCSVAVKNRSMIKIDASVQLLPKLKMPLTYFSNLLRLSDGGNAASHPAKNDYHGNPLCYSVFNPAPDGYDDDDPGHSGYLSGHC
jgi:hypothetical protein